MQENGNGESLPVKHEKRGDGANVKHDQNHCGDPVQAGPVEKYDGFFAHGDPLGSYIFHHIRGLGT